MNLVRDAVPPAFLVRDIGNRQIDWSSFSSILLLFPPTSQLIYNPLLIQLIGRHIYISYRSFMYSYVIINVPATHTTSHYYRFFILPFFYFFIFFLFIYPSALNVSRLTKPRAISHQAIFVLHYGASVTISSWNCMIIYSWTIESVCQAYM